VTHILCDEHLHHIMENEKMTFHMISLPAIDAIIELKKATGGTLSDLELLSYVLRKGTVEKEMYKMANNKQRKVLKEMEERMNELTKDPTRVSDALAAALIQATYEDDMAYYRKEGREEGRGEGTANTITLLLKTKFGELSKETISLISNCSMHELNDLIIHFYEIQCEEDIRLFLETET